MHTSCLVIVILLCAMPSNPDASGFSPELHKRPEYAKNRMVSFGHSVLPARKPFPAATMKRKTEADLSTLLRGVKIPPCPKILSDLSAEVRKENGNQKRIAALVRGDVALSAAVLRIVNSVSSTAKGSVTSVEDAVQLIGNENLVNFVVSHFVKQALGASKNAGMERFWDHAGHCANVSAMVSEHVSGTRRETAYCLGLFHDCGIPMLMQRFPDYTETLRLIGQSDAKFTETEELRHGTDHATIGYLLTKSWGLSDALCEAIRLHHDFEVLDHRQEIQAPAEACVLVGITLIAERIVSLLSRTPREPEWQQAAPLIGDFFGFAPVDLDDLVDDILFQYRQTTS